MKWGVRKSDRAARSSARSERRIARAKNRAVVTKAEIETKSKRIKYDDASIRKARANLTNADLDYRIAKAEAKALKQTQGREAVRTAMRQARLDRTLAYVRNNDQASVKTGEELVADLIGGTIALVTRGNAKPRTQRL